MILLKMQRKRCKIHLQARHSSKERHLGTHNTLALHASPPVLSVTPPRPESSLPGQAHLNPSGIFLSSRSCFGDAGSPAQLCEASPKIDAYSAATRLSETQLVSDGGSTLATMLPAHKGSRQHELTHTFKDLIFEDFVHRTGFGSLLHGEA